MGTVAVSSGQVNQTVDMLTVSAINGGSRGFFAGAIFSPTGSTITVTDSRMLSTGGAIIVPVNAAAALLLKTKSCWIDTQANGSFVFNVSATGAGAPSGSEQFNYLFFNVDLV
jgi:hypothetical protein